MKQYFKEGRALRTETVISDTHDFGIGRRVCALNWYALRAVGESANRCLCDAEAADAQPAPDVATFCRVTQPSTTDDGLYAAGLRFGEARVMTVLAALVGFCHLVRGFRNRQMVERVRALGAAPYTTRQATYDLRRLKRKGLVVKLAHTHRYQLTSLGRRVAVLFTKTYGPGAGAGLERARSAPARRRDVTQPSQHSLAHLRAGSRRLHSGTAHCCLKFDHFVNLKFAKSD